MLSTQSWAILSDSRSDTCRSENTELFSLLSPGGGAADQTAGNIELNNRDTSRLDGAAFSPPLLNQPPSTNFGEKAAAAVGALLSRDTGDLFSRPLSPSDVASSPTNFESIQE